MKVNRAVKYALLFIGIVLFVVIFSPVPIGERDYYTCSYCRMWRKAGTFFAIPYNITKKTEFTDWFEKEIKLKHEHKWRTAHGCHVKYNIFGRPISFGCGSVDIICYLGSSLQRKIFETFPDKEKAITVLESFNCSNEKLRSAAIFAVMDAPLKQGQEEWKSWWKRKEPLFESYRKLPSLSQDEADCLSQLLALSDMIYYYKNEYPKKEMEEIDLFSLEENRFNLQEIPKRCPTLAKEKKDSFPENLGVIAIDPLEGDIILGGYYQNRLFRIARTGEAKQCWELQKLDYSFPSATGITVDKKGKIYASLGRSCQIQIFDKDGKLLLKFGKQGSGNGELIYPTSLAVDEDGNIYVVDKGNNRVQKFDKYGNFMNGWGKYGTGNSEFRFSEKMASEFNEVWSNSDFAGLCGICIDDEGHIYVGDKGNTCIKKFTRDGIFMSKSEEIQYESAPECITISKKGTIYLIGGSFWEFTKELRLIRKTNYYLTEKGWEHRETDFHHGLGIGVDIYTGQIFIPNEEKASIDVFNEDGKLIRRFGNWYSGYYMENREEKTWVKCKRHPELYAFIPQENKVSEK